MLIFALHSHIISRLLNQRQKELELLFVEGVLHRKHIVVAVVEDEVCDTLLGCTDCYPKSAFGSLLRFNLTFSELLLLII